MSGPGDFDFERVFPEPRRVVRPRARWRLLLAIDRYKLWLLALGVGLVVVMILGGCSAFNDDRGIGDAPVAQQPDDERKVWPMPDRFANIAGFCIGHNGIYVTTREAAPAVVADDPECAPGGALAAAQAPE